MTSEGETGVCVREKNCTHEYAGCKDHDDYRQPANWLEEERRYCVEMVAHRRNNENEKKEEKTSKNTVDMDNHPK